MLLLNLLVFTIVAQSFAQTPCNPPADKQACINYMRQRANDTNVFWFGTPFDTGVCSRKDSNRFGDCVDGKPGGVRKWLNLGSRVFQDDFYDWNKYMLKLDGIPRITFSSQPGLKISPF